MTCVLQDFGAWHPPVAPLRGAWHLPGGAPFLPLFTGFRGRGTLSAGALPSRSLVVGVLFSLQFTAHFDSLRAQRALGKGRRPVVHAPFCLLFTGFRGRGTFCAGALPLGLPVAGVLVSLPCIARFHSLRRQGALRKGGRPAARVPFLPLFAGFLEQGAPDGGASPSLRTLVQGPFPCRAPRSWPFQT